MKLNARRGERGFSLVELLVVVTILGLISVVAIVALGGFGDANADAACRADAKTLSSAEDVAFAANEVYSTEDALVTANFLHGPISSYNVNLGQQAKSYTLAPTESCASSALVGVSTLVPPSTTTSTTTTLAGDHTAPVVVSILRSDADPTKAASLHWIVTFSENVTGVTDTDFTLVTTGSVSGQSVQTSSGSGMTYTVTVASGSGSGTLGLRLVDNDSIADTSNNKLGGNGAGNGNFTGQAYTIDRSAPTVTVNQAGGQADPANTSPINFSVVFSEPVSGFTATDVTIGGTAGGTKTALITGTGPDYNVAISGMTTAGTVTASIAASTVTDLAGNANTASTSTDNTVAYDGTAPTVLSINLANASPTSAASVSWTVTFSKSVTGVDEGDFAVASGGLGGLPAVTGVSGTGTTRTITASTGSGSGTLGLNLTDNDSIVDGSGNRLGGAGIGNGDFAGAVYTVDRTAPTVLSIDRAATASPSNAASVTWTVTFSKPVTNVVAARFGVVNGGLAGTPAVSGISGTGATYTVTASTGSGNGTLGLNLTSVGTIADSLGNALNAAPPVVGQVYTIDRAVPTVTGVSSPLGDGGYTVGQVVPVTVNFSTPVTVTGSPQLALATGTPSSTAVSYSGGSGTATLTFTYAVAAGNTSADLDYAAATSLTLNGGTIRDTAANNATLTLSAPGAAGSLGANKAIVIDTAAPAVTLTAPANNSSTSNATPTVSGGAGNVAGDSNTVVVNLYTGAGTGGSLAQTMNVSRSGAVWSTTAATLVDGTYTAQATQTDTAGNTGTSTANTFTIDTGAPSVVSVSSPLANGSYKAGQVVPVTVTFSELVAVTGTPQLTLSTGSPVATAVNYASGTGTATLTFTYTVSANNTSTDLDYASASALALNSGTIKDSAGNNATLLLPAPGDVGSLGQNKDIVIDTTAPTVSINQSVLQGDPSNASPINFTVVFSEPVSGFITGDVTLTGGATATTGTVTGSGTTYNVAVSGMASNGTVTATIAVNKALDVAGNANAASTSTDNTVTYDTTAPVVTVTAPTNGSATNDTTPTLSGAAGNASGDSATVAVTIYNGVGIGGTVVQTIPVTRSAGAWTTTLGTPLADGTYTVRATQTDSAGNLGTSSANTFAVDTGAPSVTVNQAAAQGDPTKDTPINYTVVFSETVTGFVTGDVTLTGTAGATTATVTGSGTTYNVAVTGMTSNGTVIATIGANKAADLAGNNNTASTSTDNTVTYDATKPTPTALTLANGTGTAGIIGIGDKVTITYSEPLKVSSLCSTWSGDGSDQPPTDATVTVNDRNGANSDTLSVTSTACTLNFGSVDLGSNAWLTSGDRTFGATGTKSTVQWNAATKTLTITLGTASAGTVGSGVPNVIPAYTPSTAISDPAGNTMNATSFNGTSSRF